MTKIAFFAFPHPVCWIFSKRGGVSKKAWYDPERKKCAPITFGQTCAKRSIILYDEKNVFWRKKFAGFAVFFSPFSVQTCLEGVKKGLSLVQTLKKTWKKFPAGEGCSHRKKKTRIKVLGPKDSHFRQKTGFRMYQKSAIFSVLGPKSLKNLWKSAFSPHRKTCFFEKGPYEYCSKKGSRTHHRSLALKSPKLKIFLH